MQRFLETVFEPHLKRMDTHVGADDRRFETLNTLVGRVSTSIEVSAAVQQAQLAQSERFFKSVWTKITVAAMILSPLVAVGIAVWKH